MNSIMLMVYATEDNNGNNVAVASLITGTRGPYIGGELRAKTAGEALAGYASMFGAVIDEKIKPIADNLENRQ